MKTVNLLIGLCSIAFVTACGTPSMSRHQAFGINFVVGRMDTPEGFQTYLSAEGSTERAIGFLPDTYLLVTSTFDPEWVIKGLSSSYSDAALMPGSLFAGINLNRNPQSDGIELAFRTTGSIVWRGMRFSTGPNQQLVFLQSLRWKDSPREWYMNFGEGTRVAGEGWVECEGFLQFLATAAIQPDKPSAQPAWQKHVLLTCAGAKSTGYVLSLEPETYRKLRTADGSLQLGGDHLYRVIGFVDKSAEKVFAPPRGLAEVLVTTKIEQLR